MLLGGETWNLQIVPFSHCRDHGDMDMLVLWLAVCKVFHASLITGEMGNPAAALDPFRPSGPKGALCGAIDA